MDKEEVLSALALVQQVEMLRLALAALELVDAGGPTSIGQVRGLQDQCAELEVRTVALLRYADVPWESLATELGSRAPIAALSP